MKNYQRFYLVVKRIIGIFGSLLGIVFCLIFLWWWVIFINLFVTKGHPFFYSIRVGKDGKEFKLLKFRSMKYGTDPNITSLNTQSKKDVTRFGKFLRRTSIDETPQLLNILIGQMAFIGPRPLIDYDEDAITNKIRIENGSIKLRPGLTGYAQIHRRSKLGPVEKAEYDYLYYQKFSFWLDVKIFIFTILNLFSGVKGK